MFYTVKTACTPLHTACVQDTEKIESCSFYVYQLLKLNLKKALNNKQKYANHLFRDIKH